MLLLDRYLPESDARLLRRRVVDADPETAWQALRRVDFRRQRSAASSWRVRALSLPFSRSLLPPPGSKAASLDDLERHGWRLLDEAPGTEVVFGAIGRPWKADGDLLDFAPSEFGSCDAEGRCRFACGLVVRPHPGGQAVLTYETRWRAEDAEARRRCQRSWRIARPAITTLMDNTLRALEADCAREPEPEARPRGGQPAHQGR